MSPRAVAISFAICLVLAALVALSIYWLGDLSGWANVKI